MDPDPEIPVSSDSLTESWLEECLKSSPDYHLVEETPISRDIDSSDQFIDEKKDIKTAASKPHSTPLTLKWLDDNYEIVEGVCIPRSTLYVHYLDFCEKNDCQPVNAASFGKIIRQQFPQITTRRLGTRGQSKYHYYGVGVKETSPYYDVMYSSQGIQSSADGKKDTGKQVIAYSPRSKLGTLLPEFPNVDDLKLPADVPQEKVVTFLMMYRTHCQRILDTVIRANFDEVQSFLLHFWQGMPQHMVPILGSPCITNLVGVCDSILYKAISGVLMPTVLQALPESLTQVIRKFAKQLGEWIQSALEGLPETLNTMKSTLAKRFAQSLRRQTSLNHLCQASRTVIHSADITAQMLEDWYSVDLNGISKQTLYTMQKYGVKEYTLITSLCKDFENLMEDQEPIELYTEWLDRMIDICVIQSSEKNPGTMKQKARQFLLTWSFFGTRVIRDMTLHSAPSFGSFHLLHLMFDDYVMYQVESLCSQETANELLLAAKGENSTGVSEEVILPNPSISLISPSTFDPCLTPSTLSSGIEEDCRTPCSITYDNTRSAFTSTQAAVQHHFDGSLQMAVNVEPPPDIPYPQSTYPMDSYGRNNSLSSLQDPIYNSYGFGTNQYSGNSTYNCQQKSLPGTWPDVTPQSNFQAVIQRNNTLDLGNYDYTTYPGFPSRPQNSDSFQPYSESTAFFEVGTKRPLMDNTNDADRGHKRLQTTDFGYHSLSNPYQLS